MHNELEATQDVLEYLHEEKIMEEIQIYSVNYYLWILASCWRKQELGIEMFITNCEVAGF